MARRDISRRSFLHWAALAGGGAALAACGATPTPQVVEKVVEREVTKIVEGTPQVVKETVVVQQTVVVEQTVAVETIVTATAVAGAVPKLRYLTDWYGGDRGELVSQFLGQFAEQRGDIATVAYEPAPEVGARLRVEFASGTAPDIFLWSFSDTPEFKDWLLDLAPMYDVDPDINEEDIVKNSPIFYENGQKLALPFQGLFYGAAANIDLMAQAGLPMPWEHDHNGDKWWDWNDWLEAAIAIRNLGEDIWGCNLDNDVHGPGWFSWVYGNGGSYWNPETFETTMSSDPATVEAMTFQYDLMCTHQVGIPFEEYNSLQESLGISPIAAGKVGLPARFEERAAAAAQINVQRVGLPRAPQTGTFMSNHNHQPNCISAKTPLAKEAWELGKFFASAEVQLAIGLNGTSQPMRFSVLEGPDYFQGQPATAREALVEQVRKGEFYPVFKGWGEWRNEVLPIMEKLFTCEGKPAEVLAEVDQVGTEIMQRYNS
ncbi:MAG: extracellular solute-binding protein [Anaerolineae bacterium]